VIFFSLLLLPLVGALELSNTRARVYWITSEVIKKSHSLSFFLTFWLFWLHSPTKGYKYLIPFWFLASLGPWVAITIGKPMVVQEYTCCASFLLPFLFLRYWSITKSTLPGAFKGFLIHELPKNSSNGTKIPLIFMGEPILVESGPRYFQGVEKELNSHELPKNSLCIAVLYFLS